MLNWQVGRVEITRIVEMDLPVPAMMVIPQATPEELRKSPWLYPHFVTEDDSTLKVSIHALPVEAPGLKLVVDTCVGNYRPRDITGGEPLRTPFLQHLAEAGWSRETVDTVVCTHLHVDHVGWTPCSRTASGCRPSPRRATSSAGASTNTGLLMTTRSNRQCSAIVSSRSSTLAWPSWSRRTTSSRRRSG